MFRVAATSLTLLCLSGAGAAAQDASAWDKGLHSAARLIAGAAHATSIQAAIEIQLAPGWHTYWRDPGDSGAPPTFDFAGSDNVQSVTVLWPAPERFPDGAGGYSIGYRENVIFPLRIVPKDAASASTVHLKLSYAVCEKLCFPANANLQLNLIGSGTEAAKISKVEARVPRRVALGAGTTLRIRSVRHDEADRVVVDVAAPDDVPVDLFAEGPTPEWSLPLPEMIDTEPGMRRFAFKLEGLPPGAQVKDAALTLTAVTPAAAIEVATPVE